MRTPNLQGRNRLLLPTSVALAILLVASPAAFYPANAGAVEVDVGVDVGGGSGTTVSGNVTASSGIEAKGSIDATVKAGASTTHELTISNPSDQAITLSLSAEGEAAPWMSLSHTNIIIAAKSSQTVQVTISPPPTTAHGSYAATITIAGNAGTTGSIFVKVQVPQLLFEVSPSVITVVVKPGSMAEATILILNAGEADISDLRVSVEGEAASNIDLSTSTLQLKAQGVADTKLLIDVGDLAPGTYTAKVTMTAEDGTRQAVDVNIHVSVEPVEGAEARVTSSQGITLVLDGTTAAGASSTVSIKPDVLAALGISIDVTPGTSREVVVDKRVSGSISDIATIDVKSEPTVEGRLDVHIAATVKAGARSGIHAGTVTLMTRSGAQIEIPVIAEVKMQAVAHGALLIDGSDEDWANLEVKAAVTDPAGDEDGADVAVDLVAVSVTDSSDAVLIVIKVAGDMDSTTRLYAVRFDANLDGNADYTLEFRGSQAMLVDANGNVVTSVSAIAWAYSSGTLEAAIDRAQFQSVIGSSFKTQVIARGSYDETAWFPTTQPYSLQGAGPSIVPSAPSPNLLGPVLILGVIAAVAAAAIAFVAYRRKPHHPAPPLSS